MILCRKDLRSEKSRRELLWVNPCTKAGLVPFDTSISTPIIFLCPEINFNHESMC